MKSKKNLIILAIVITISLIGVTYAFFDYYKLGEVQKIVGGRVNLILNEGTDTINISNVFPESKEKARARTNNQITFTVSGENTTTNKDIWYEIMLNEGDPEEGMIRFKPEHLVFDLIEVNGDTETYLVDAMSFSDINARRIWVNTVDRNTTTVLNKTYKLRMWLSEDVYISDTGVNPDYPATGYENYYASVKVSVYGDFVEKGLHLNQVAQSTLPLTEPDVDGTRYVYGQTVDNNYVWYSGKLWRIVSIDKDGNIKLVTQGNMTTIGWDADYSTDYGTSQIRKWLNKEFLPTLHNADNLLISSKWDYTTYESFPSFATGKLSTTSSVVDKVGLLNVYEIMMTGGTGDSSTSNNTFLDNGYSWWTISPQMTDTFVWFCYQPGSNSYFSGTSFSREDGVRPSVNLKSNIKLTGNGNGTKEKPYLIEGGQSILTNLELLSNRISGEYIKFNDVKYRIVGTEEINGKKLTKITMADYNINNNSLVPSLIFGETYEQKAYSTDYGIGLYLHQWYQADETSTAYANIYIKDIYKTMIATEDIVWYTGIETTSSDYTLSKTGNAIKTPIGLGYYGEMFSSQFGDGHNSSLKTWLITLYNTWGVRAIDNSGYINAHSSYNNNYNSLAVRPSFYLKSNVVIGDTNGDGKVGTGMPHDPYEIVQLSE